MVRHGVLLLFRRASDRAVFTLSVSLRLPGPLANWLTGGTKQLRAKSPRFLATRCRLLGNEARTTFLRPWPTDEHHCVKEPKRMLATLWRLARKPSLFPRIGILITAAPPSMHAAH